jgi:ATP-dependent DNA helicase RecG
MVKATGWSLKLVSIEKRFKPSVLKDAGIIERYGSGIKRILEWFSMYGLGQPVFEELQEGFRVTIYRTTQKTTQKFSTKEHM